MKTHRKKLTDECDALWSKCVKTRDRVCRLSGSDSNLQAHHIAVRQHKATRWDLDNGITLSQGEHFRGHMDPEAFRDRIIEVIGQSKYDELKERSRRMDKVPIHVLQFIKEKLTAELKRLESEYGELC